jgi:hypothetical protein
MLSSPLLSLPTPHGHLRMSMEHTVVPDHSPLVNQRHSSFNATRQSTPQALSPDTRLLKWY